MNELLGFYLQLIGAAIGFGTLWNLIFGFLP